MFKRVLAGLLTCLVALGCLAANPAPALAALSESDYSLAARMLNKYGLVQGDDRGYRFYAQITRAEMAKLLVYALGVQADAPRYTGRGIFSDTQGHWADGVISVAKVAGIMNGYPDGTFGPEAPVTYAEVITALSRLAGLESSGEPWPRTYLGPAIGAGIVPAGLESDLRLRLNESAARGDVFVMLWRTLTEVKNYNGQTLLRRYVDQTAPGLTVDPQPAETTDVSLTVTGTVKDAARVVINGTDVHFDLGYFTHTVSLRVGPNTIRIQAVDDAGNIKEQVVQVTRTQAPPGSIALTGPAQVGAGQSATYSVVLRDSNGEAVTDRKGVQATVTPADLGTFDAQTGAFKAGTKPGQGSITVSAGSATYSLPVAVVAGALDRLAVSPAEVGLAPGGVTQFTARGYDAYGNEVSLTGVTWTATGGSISTGGLYQAPAAMGAQTITARAGGKIATATVQPPNFEVASITVTQQPGVALRANGVSETTLTATLLDAAGKPVTTYSGNLLVSSSAPATANPVLYAVPVVNGTATIRVRAGTLAGTAQIIVSTNLARTGTAAVTVQPQQLQSVRLTGFAQGSMDTWASGYIEAVALDQDGNPMRSALTQALVVHLKLPDEVGGKTAWFVANDAKETDVALQTVDPTAGDVRTRTYIRYTPGMGTILIQGEARPAAMSWVNVMPGALVADQVGMPAGVKIEPLVDGTAGVTQSVYVNVVDVNGFRVTQAAPLANVVVTLRDSNGITWPATVTPQAGSGRARFDVVQAQAGSFTYTATLQPGYATDVAVGRVISGGVAGVKLTATPATLKADNSSVATLRAELVDVAGNLVTNPPYQVKFRQVSNNGALQPFGERTVTSSGGVATLTVTAGTVVGPEQIQVEVANPAAPGSPYTASLTVNTRGVPDHLAIRYGDNDGDGVAADPEDYRGRVGVPLTVYVDVLDRFGNLCTFDTGRSITLTLKNLTTGAETALPAAATRDGVATFPVTRSDAATYAIKAESAAVTRAVTVGYGGTLADAVLQAGNGLRVKLGADMTTLQTSSTFGGNYALVTAQLTDENGNITTNRTGAPVTVILTVQGDVTAYGAFTVNDMPAGAPTLVRSVQILPGASAAQPVKFFAGGSSGSPTIEARTLDGMRDTITITTTTLGSAAKLVVDPVAPVNVEPWTNADSAMTGQLLVATVQDSSGRRLSSYNGSVTLGVLDAGTVVVAVWNPVVQAWQSLDSAPGNGQGNYPSSAIATADRGQARFLVRANTAGTKHYQLGAGASSDSPPTATATGRFDGAGPQYMTVTADRPTVAAGGTVSLSARIYDAYDTHLTSLTGTVTFTITAGSSAGGFPGAGPLTVSLVNGVATVTFTAASPATDTPVTVQATTTVTQANGAAVTGDPVTFTVKAAAP